MSDPSHKIVDDHDAKFAAELILARRRRIETLEGEIDAIAKKRIPDFHFLNHKVSTFWRCEKSPIGMCVFLLGERGFNINCHCRYCGGPVERK